MAIEQYLKGKVDFNLALETIQAILFDRGIEEGSPLSIVTEKQKDLALADVYMFLATSSVSSSSSYESDGGWQKQTSSKNVTNRAALADLAKALYAKWGEAPAATTTGKVTMKPLY